MSRQLDLFSCEEEYAHIMQSILVTASVIFISTSIDDLVLLMLFQAQAGKKSERLSILGGQFVGIGILVIISLFGAYFATRLLQGWAIGLLGLLPLFLGIRSLVSKDGEETSQKNRKKSLLATVSVVTIASGADNLGIYIPWFTLLERGDLYLALGVFALMILLFFALSALLAGLPQVRLLLTRFSSVLVPVVFIILGLSILSEQGTFKALFQAF